MRKTILVTDMDLDVCDELVEVIAEQELGFVVGTATDRAQTMQLIEEYHPDLVVLDLLLPGQDGVFILKEIAKLDHKPIVVATASNVSDSLASDTAAWGARYLALKPYDKYALAEHIKSLLYGDPMLDNKKLSTEIFNSLRDTGIPANMLGYQYLKKALQIAVQNPKAILRATEKVFLPVAEDFGVKHTNIQSAISRAIKTGWDRADLDTLQSYFGYTVSNAKMFPTATEYIATVSERIRTRLDLVTVENLVDYEDEIVDDKITRLFYNLSIPHHIKGYQYLREAIFIAIQEDMELAHITPGIYQKVADNFQTTTERVKRAMQHGIEVMMEKASADQVDAFFGPTINLATFKPTISEFLAAAVEGIRLELQYEANNE